VDCTKPVRQGPDFVAFSVFARVFIGRLRTLNLSIKKDTDGIRNIPPNPLIHLQTALLVRESAARSTSAITLSADAQLAGKGSLQILLEEFHNPYRGQVPIDAF
jgi:hypothetical protein